MRWGRGSHGSGLGTENERRLGVDLTGPRGSYPKEDIEGTVEEKGRGRVRVVNRI